MCYKYQKNLCFPGWFDIAHFTPPNSKAHEVTFMSRLLNLTIKKSLHDFSHGAIGNISNIYNQLPSSTANIAYLNLILFIE